MRELKRVGAAALMAAALALGASASASAAPAAGIAIGPAAPTDGALLQIRDGGGRWQGGGGGRGGHWGGRGHWGGGHGGHFRGRHHRGFRNDGAWIGLGVAGALLADGLYDGDYYDYDSDAGPSSGAAERCAATFRSFEWDTGLYTTYGGQKRVCPYLD